MFHTHIPKHDSKQKTMHLLRLKNSKTLITAYVLKSKDMKSSTLIQ